MKDNISSRIFLGTEYQVDNIFDKFFSKALRSRCLHATPAAASDKLYVVSFVFPLLSWLNPQTLEHAISHHSTGKSAGLGVTMAGTFKGIRIQHIYINPTYNINTT